MILGDQVLLKGCGKTHWAVLMMWQMHLLLKEKIILTNIPFFEIESIETIQGKVQYAGTPKMPDGVVYVDTFIDFLRAASAYKILHPYAIIILFIDEISVFLNNLQGATKEARLLQKFLDLTRKFPMVLVGISPRADKLPSVFVDNVYVWMYKDKHKAGIADNFYITSGHGLNEKNTVFVEGGLADFGYFETMFEVGSCPWTGQGAHIGSIIYNHRATASFEIEDELMEKEIQKALFRAMAGGLDKSQMFQRILDFIDDLDLGRPDDYANGDKGSSVKEGMSDKEIFMKIMKNAKDKKVTARIIGPNGNPQNQRAHIQIDPRLIRELLGVPKSTAQGWVGRPADRVDSSL